MKLTTKNKRFVNEVGYGVYLWQMPDGSLVQTAEGEFMLIQGPQPGSKLARERMQQLRDFAKAHGITEGQPVYMDGNRPVTDDEYTEQKQRLLFGLTPDPLDVGAIRDERRNIK